MKHEIFPAYRALFEQAFVPIFVKDAFDTATMLEGCRLAGVRVIEYTLRREDADRVIPTLKKAEPNRFVFVGSTLDSERVVRKMKEKFPQIMTIPEILGHGVDGIISMLPMQPQNIAKYAERAVVIPSAETLGESLAQVDAGAHFIKRLGTELDRVKLSRAAPTFDFCPLFVTGGVTVERMPEVFGIGGMVVGAGFDMLLKDIRPETLTPEMVAGRLTAFISAAKAARAKAWPQLAGLETLSDAEWLSRLPFYHTFG